MAVNPDDIKAKLQEAFSEADADGDGAICHDDLKTVLRNAGLKPTDEQVEQIISAADADGSGNLNFEEFATAVVELGAVIIIGMILRAIFDELDSDGSGFISPDDLRKVTDEAGYGDKVTDEQLQEVVSQCDADGDGKISFEEFALAVASLVEEAE